MTLVIKIEWDENRIWPKWNVTKTECDQTECDQNGMWPKRNVTKKECDQNGMWMFTKGQGSIPPLKTYSPDRVNALMITAFKTTCQQFMISYHIYLLSLDSSSALQCFSFFVVLKRKTFRASRLASVFLLDLGELSLTRSCCCNHI